MDRTHFKLLVLVLCLSMATSAPAPLIYRPGQGWEVEGKDTVEETSADQLAKGKHYEDAGKNEEASQAYHALVQTWPLSPNAAEAQFRYAKMLSKLFDFQRSFKEYQTCLEKYPDSEHFEESLMGQFEIANLFLHGERVKIWKIPTLPSMDKTVEMFEKVIKNGPYSSVAPMAQISIGFAREKQHQWDSAVKAYQELIRKYPTSHLADDAQFQIGYAYMLASREADYDQTATNRAITAFEDYITKYRKSEKAPQARANIENLRHEQTRGYMKIAEFYDQKKNYDAALIYYNNVIQKFPGTDLAKRATVRAEEIKKRQFEAMGPELQKGAPNPAVNSPPTATSNPTPSTVKTESPTPPVGPMPAAATQTNPPTAVEVSPPLTVGTNAPPVAKTLLPTAVETNPLPAASKTPSPATPKKNDSAPSIFDDDAETPETNSQAAPGANPPTNP